MKARPHHLKKSEKKTLDDLFHSSTTPIIIRREDDFEVVDMNAPAIELFEGADAPKADPRQGDFGSYVMEHRQSQRWFKIIVNTWRNGECNHVIQTFHDISPQTFKTKAKKKNTKVFHISAKRRKRRKYSTNKTDMVQYALEKLLPYSSGKLTESSFSCLSIDDMNELLLYFKSSNYSSKQQERDHDKPTKRNRCKWKTSRGTT